MFKLKERHINQPIAGTFSFNTNNSLKGTLDRVSVNPSSTTTTYDIEITDDDNTVIYERKGRKGHFVDDSDKSVYGIHTVTISNASESTKSWITTLLWREEI